MIWSWRSVSIGPVAITLAVTPAGPASSAIGLGYRPADAGAHHVGEMKTRQRLDHAGGRGEVDDPPPAALLRHAGQTGARELDRRAEDQVIGRLSQSASVNSANGAGRGPPVLTIDAGRAGRRAARSPTAAAAAVPSPGLGEVGARPSAAAPSSCGDRVAVALAGSADRHLGAAGDQLGVRRPGRVPRVPAVTSARRPARPSAGKGMFMGGSGRLQDARVTRAAGGADGGCA